MVKRTVSPPGIGTLSRADYELGKLDLPSFMQKFERPEINTRLAAYKLLWTIAASESYEENREVVIFDTVQADAMRLMHYVDKSGTAFCDALRGLVMDRGMES